jgi:hypothetical protein
MSRMQVRPTPVCGITLVRRTGLSGQSADELRSMTSVAAARDWRGRGDPLGVVGLESPETSVLSHGSGRASASRRSSGIAGSLASDACDWLRTMRWFCLRRRCGRAVAAGAMDGCDFDGRSMLLHDEGDMPQRILARPQRVQGQ